MAQSPEQTWLQDICMSQVLVCYIYICALLNYFLLDWYRTTTRMTMANNHHVQDNKQGFKMQMMHLKCLGKFFSFSFFDTFFLILLLWAQFTLRHLTTTSTTLSNSNRVQDVTMHLNSLACSFFLFYLYILSYFIIIGSIYLKISDDHYHHPCHPWK